MEARRKKQVAELRHRLSSLTTGSSSDIEKDAYIIEDDDRVREALHDLLASGGIPSVIFGRTVDYLGNLKPDIPSCLLVDIKLPDMNALDLLHRVDVLAHPGLVETWPC